MSKIDKYNLEHITLSEITITESKGEIPCLIIYSDIKHVPYIQNLLNPIHELLPKLGFNPKLLSEEIAPLKHYGQTIDELMENCALCIVIMDGLRPNVLLEFGIALGKHKPIIVIQDIDAKVSIKSYYNHNHKSTGLTILQYDKLHDPPLGYFKFISDLQGLHTIQVDRRAKITDKKHPKNILKSEIERLSPIIVKEYNRIILKPTPQIRKDYFEKFQSIVFNISDFYTNNRKYTDANLSYSLKILNEIEKNAKIFFPYQIYFNIAALFRRLARNQKWDNIENKITYFNNALEIYSNIIKVEKDKIVISQTYQNQGNIYREISSINDPANNSKKAVKAYSEALKVRTLEKFPIQYGMTQNNLGIAYGMLATIESKTANCKNAILALKEALKVRTLEKFPIQYGTTQINLGNSYRILSEVESKSNNSKTAIKAYKEALKVFSSEKYPTDYSMAQNNLGNAYGTLAEVESKATNCKKAIAAHKEALKVYTFEKYPTDYGMTQNNLGTAYGRLAEIESKAANCKKAIVVLKKALKVRTLEKFPIDYGTTQNNLGNSYDILAEVESKAANCKKAIIAHKEALRVRPIEKFPMDYGMTQNNLGTAYRTLADVESKAKNCKMAINALEEALKVYTFEKYPMDYGMAQNNLGNAYSTLAGVELKAANCKKAIKAYEEALRAYPKTLYLQTHKLISNNLIKCLKFCNN